ncbi:hypothetical protein CDL15_Pgr014834 [Punica granatum]|uniref:Disease resistance R13L4/SHOC-2-like LRR domain-containing protein n=1 Tax=Punica granatum TaxID=22663 RepID=A0A218Y162_PUNGR|nr:hypothetical protein CDL15_Pgr014834 [Punica granatum]
MYGMGGSSSSSFSVTKPAAQRPPRPSSSHFVAARSAPSPRTRTILSTAIARSLSVGSKEPAPPSPPPLFPNHCRGEIVTDVAQKRQALLELGSRPDHEKVDAAKSRLREVEARLSKKLQEIVLSPRPENLDRLEWRAHLAEKERACREAAEKEISAYRAIVSLDEMHQECERLLREAEKRLVRMYESAEEKTKNRRYAEPRVSGRVSLEFMNLLPDSLEKSRLERVTLSGRRLRFLPDELMGRIRGVVVLNLSGNQLEDIPDSVAVLDKLEELNISSNLLSSLPDSVGSLDKMKVLNASGNKLSTLPDTISCCRSLVELDVSFNNLAYLPTDIGYGLFNLEVLSIQYNKVRSLPTSIGEMKSLRHLDVHFNELHGLPPSIGKLRNLRTLNLSSNFTDLTELPDTIGDLTELKELDLSSNQIHTLPLSFARLNKLMKLNLDQNPLVFPPVEVVSEGIEAIRLFMVKRQPRAFSEGEDGELARQDESWMDCFRMHDNSNWREVS